MGYPELPVTEGGDTYKDRIHKSRYTREDKETDDLRNNERKSPSDIYRFNGEDIKPKSENGNIDDNILMQLFKEQDAPVSPSKFSKLSPTLPSQSSHAHPYKPEASWLEMNYLSKMEGYQLPSQAPFAGTGCTYVGGPNITPLYHKITGQLLESNKSDSSSTSGTDSSPTHSQNGRNETKCRIKDFQTESIRMGKDEKIAKEAGIRFNVKQDIVIPPMDEFNDMLSKEDLSEEQLNICRDIRRRGKNKVAAQNCRKRKIEQIDELQERLDEAKRRQYQLQANHEKLLSSYSSEASKLTRLTDTVLAHHNKNPHQYLVQVEGEEVKILPKSAVAEKDRIPRPLSSMRPNYLPEHYSSGSHSPNARGMYNTSNLEQCARRGWE